MVRRPLIASILAVITVSPVCAQQRAQTPPPGPRAMAPVDLTGYWVSVVTSDWRHRMLPPLKGDFESIPLTPEGRRVANLWDPAKDEAAGEQCQAYGAAGLMRVPGRLRITWDSDTTLRIDTDAGTQTRLLRFGATPPPSAPRDWAGYSIARWEAPTASIGIGPRPDLRRLSGSLEVITINMRAGYLRKNGVPYSENARMTEYFTRLEEPNGDIWLIVQTIVEDPLYLDHPFITSTPFRKQADASGWNPTPCTSR